MKLLNTILTTAITTGLIFFCISAPAFAAEIHPAASSYSYGSTSEFSTSSQVTPSSSSDLAPTGQNKNIPIIIGATVVLVGVGILVTSQRKLRKHK